MKNVKKFLKIGAFMGLNALVIVHFANEAMIDGPDLLNSVQNLSSNLNWDKVGTLTANMLALFVDYIVIKYASKDLINNGKVEEDTKAAFFNQPLKLKMKF